LLVFKLIIRVGKAAGAGVQLPEQKSGAYKIKREMV
jgi:hypothetical protein